MQATYILDMQLRRLTRFSRLELEKERDELVETIAALTTILDDDALLRRTVSSELADVAKTHGDPAADGAPRVGRAPGGGIRVPARGG